MRGFLTCSIGVTCASALTLAPAVLTVPSAAAAPADRTTTAALSGSTQSLPLTPRTRERVLGQAPEQGAYSTGVHHFSLVGVVWDNPGAELHGKVQVRTRSAATGHWSDWQDIDTHTADVGADPDTAEASSGRVHGATAPLWVGDSNGVDVRVRAEADDGSSGDSGGRSDDGLGDDSGGRSNDGLGDGLGDGLSDGLSDDPADDSAPHDGGLGIGRDLLPTGLRLELVDPGDDAPSQSPSADSPRTDTDTEADSAAAVNAGLVSFAATEIPALSREDTERELRELNGADASLAKPYIGPRPRIVTRRGWGADESLREKGFVYTGKIKAAFVHHTASGNGYRCSEAPSVIRGIYRYHVVSMGWRDIGYNFLVDKCGTIYEGRAGGAAKAVRGAHTLGFNNDSMGVAVIGTYGSHQPSAAAVTGVAGITAWKLGLYAANPKGKTYLTSGGGNLYPKGKNVRLNVISGHRDGYATDCPGAKLYAKLGSARTTSAHLQGR
ncbi:peptidoglycan recognition protein family protein [Streptomyces shenzhenensis]|uniref:peptidoglycan recognition protein family protein n=1 Tax=Streptomyces shenzhenensis TaxID=943815 RepID=UPI0015F02F6D|nr:peptidoglycan recognition protein [Streptomyces shenzhenensis]